MRALALNITSIIIIRLRLQHVGGSDKVRIVQRFGYIEPFYTSVYGSEKGFFNSQLFTI